MFCCPDHVSELAIPEHSITGDVLISVFFLVPFQHWYIRKPVYFTAIYTGEHQALESNSNS
jgi:hypothetical protein